MFSAFTYQQMAQERALFDDMLQDRGRQFVARHGWTLTRDARGREIDNFDRCGTTYCVVSDADRHLASLRVRPAAEDAMTKMLAPGGWDHHIGLLSTGLEVTRLCCSPLVNTRDQSLHMVDLLIGLCRFGLAQDTPLLFGLVFPGVARSIKRAGWESTVLDTVQLDGRPVLLCAWTCSPTVDWLLQERHEKLATAQPQIPLQRVA